MLKSIKKEKLAKEGYVYVSYGHPKYLKHTVASVVTLRRYDSKRPVVICCTEKQKSIIEEKGLTHLFDVIHPLPEEHASIVGFKHNIHEYLFFERNIFLDSDIVWCKDPEPMWTSLSPHPFTITGTMVSDNFFGASKNLGVIKDVLLRRRKRTLKRFGLTYLSRVQTGLMYAQDYETTKKVCTLASEMLSKKDLTHFQSRKMEKGRTEESCEWSLAMAMSKLDIPVYPWLQGHNSLQLDYIGILTDHDDDFEYVNCKYYSHDFVYSLRGLKSDFLKKLIISVLSIIPGKGDYMLVTPFCLHFGWYHEKQPFFEFAEHTWIRLTSRRYQGNEKASVKEIAHSRK
ncbi:MAG: hypothetical protein FH748_16935 [Balneolaceae bacterium]|nr:hypothetical protein [Balneolaceae bacterium]